jgi:hypothetical protein
MPPKMLFPATPEEVRWGEVEARGYLYDVIVELESGSRFSLSFMNPTTIAEQTDGHSLYVAGLVVVPAVTLEAVTAAISELHARDAFSVMLPTQQWPEQAKPLLLKHLM